MAETQQDRVKQLADLMKGFSSEEEEMFEKLFGGSKGKGGSPLGNLFGGGGEGGGGMSMLDPLGLFSGGGPLGGLMGGGGGGKGGGMLGK